MTEAEWLACTDPIQLLQFLRRCYAQLSARKLRLLGAEYCKDILNYSTEPQVRKAVLTLERFAEEQVSESELQHAHRAAEHVWAMEFGCDRVSAAVTECARYVAGDPFRAATSAAMIAGEAAELRAGRGTREAECIWQCQKIRDFFHSPYRAVFMQHRWLAWNDGAIPKMAQAIYDDRAFGRLPLLADALEEAGCTDPGLLSHCRSGLEHVRGCWVVDLLLGKS